MSGIELLRNTVLVVFVINGLLLLSLIIGKDIHRRREQNHERRRVAYLALLSRHLSDPDEELSMGPRVAEDQAFLDALIDIRTSVVGAESDALTDMVERYGVMEGYAKRVKRGPGLTRRLQAAVAIAEVADSSWAPVLMAHLQDRHPEIRIQAARGLSRMRWTPAIDSLVERLSSESPWVRSRLMDALISFGSRAVWQLIAYIRINHRHESAGPTAAIRTLATIGDHQAVEPLIEILGESHDPEVMIAIVEALGVLAAPTALSALERSAHSGDWRIRAKAATALGEISNPAAIPTLGKGLKDPNWWMRRNSAAALARVPGGVQVLYSAIGSEDPFARDAASEALADAGEVIAARKRIEGGEATSQDEMLIEFIESDLVVTA